MKIVPSIIEKLLWLIPEIVEGHFSGTSAFYSKIPSFPYGHIALVYTTYCPFNPAVDILYQDICLTKILALFVLCPRQIYNDI